MATVREIALEQALIAVIGAVKVEGYDDKKVVDRAIALLLGNNVLHHSIAGLIIPISTKHADFSGQSSRNMDKASLGQIS